MNNLMEIQQLPIITERLSEIKADIEKRTSCASKLVCTDESVVEIKKIRSDFNKEFSEFETSRKKIKTAITQPYIDFENVYKQHISEPYKKADAELKTKIDIVESTLKMKKEEEVKTYFDELKTAESLSFINYADIGFNITLSASLKSLKDKCKEFVEKVKTDLQLIDSQENSSEILNEYKTSYNVSQAIMNVKNRHEAIEQIRKSQEERKAKEDQLKAETDKLNEIVAEQTAPIELSAPVEVEKTYTTSFKVTGTLSQLKALKEFLNNGGYTYEC